MVAFICHQLMGIGSLRTDYRNNNNNKYSIGTMNTFLSNIERSIINETQVGDIFMLVFKDDIGMRKIARHAVLVDVTDASNEVYLKGVLLHLTANSITRIGKFCFDDEPRRRSDFHEIVYIGKLVPPTHIHPMKCREWTCSLVIFGDEIFYELTNSETNKTWLSAVNCQTFCKVLLKHFGFKWPVDLPCVDDDIIPVIMDLSIAFISSKARKFLKKANNRRTIISVVTNG